MKWLYFSLLCFFSILTGQSLYFFRKGFSINRLHTEIKSLTTSSMDQETAKILQQRFHYLGRGRQCFAFASEDGKYVLKCVRTDKFKIPFWRNLLKCDQYRRNKIERKMSLVFESFRIAKDEIGDLTGTLALHLEKSSPTNQKFTITDPLGITHYLPVDSTLFILQDRKALWSTIFQKSDTQQKKQMLDSFIDLIVQRSQKGIINRDPNFLSNYGYEMGKTFQIDIGDFRRSPDFVYHKALQDSLSPVKSWLEKTDPTMHEYLSHRLENL